MIQVIVQDTPDATKKTVEQSVVVDYAKAQSGMDILLLGQHIGLKVRCERDRIVVDYRAEPEPGFWVTMRCIYKPHQGNDTDFARLVAYVKERQR